MHKRPKQTKITTVIFNALILMRGRVAIAAPLTVINFVPGAVETAADANAKFAEVEKTVNDNSSNIGANATSIGTNAVNIGANTAAIGTDSNE